MLDMADLRWLKEKLDEMWEMWEETQESLKREEERKLVKRRGKLTVATKMSNSECIVWITDGERLVGLREDEHSSDLSTLRDFLALVLGEGFTHPQLLELVEEEIEEMARECAAR